jgi:endonuclease/exonuclease/phosphatase family metal-dependent hydrolase
MGRLFGKALFLVFLSLTLWFAYHLVLERAGNEGRRAGSGVTNEDLPPSPARVGNLRVVAWNIRNFPRDERPQYPDLGYSRLTNKADLEAVLAGLRSDILGVEEIRQPKAFREVVDQAMGKGVVAGVFSRKGGRWGQHVGILWNRGRMRQVGATEEVSSVALGNPDLRPALAVGLRSTRPEGLDLTVVQVHLRAAPSGYETRLEQYRALAAWVRQRIAVSGDDDVVVQGDFNTTGSDGGTVGEELARADAILGRAGLRRLPNQSGCSEYWEGRGPRDGKQVPSLLDQVYVSGMEELDQAVPLLSWLHCAREDCRPFMSRPGQEDGTFWDVSDHCPLTFEVRDVDIDGPEEHRAAGSGESLSQAP